MTEYRVTVWAGAPVRLAGRAEPRGDLLETFQRAGRTAVRLRRATLPAGREQGDGASTWLEATWLACACGPLWVFVAAAYLASWGG